MKKYLNQYNKNDKIQLQRLKLKEKRIKNDRQKNYRST